MQIITRRTALVHLAAAVAGPLMHRGRALAKAPESPTRQPRSGGSPQPATPVNFDVPAGACDCHTHIFGDPARFPFWSGRTYTPEPASIAAMRTLHRALHMDRVVIVHPSVYGTDNACTLDAIRQLGTRARGVAVIDEKTSDAQLDEMHRGGIRGIRLNLETFGQTDPSGVRQRLQAAFRQLSGRPWHVQLYTRLSVIQGIQELVSAAPVPVVFDHFGLAQASLGVEQPGFAALVDLVRRGKSYVKISGAYRASTKAPDYPDAAPLAKALIAANPERILWGTDWPHPPGVPVSGGKATDVVAPLQIDDGRLLNQLPIWAPDAAVRKTILVENPARLYGL